MTLHLNINYSLQPFNALQMLLVFKSTFTSINVSSIVAVQSMRSEIVQMKQALYFKTPNVSWVNIFKK